MKELQAIFKELLSLAGTEAEPFKAWVSQEIGQASSVPKVLMGWARPEMWVEPKGWTGPPGGPYAYPEQAVLTMCNPYVGGRIQGVVDRSGVMWKALVETLVGSPTDVSHSIAFESQWGERTEPLNREEAFKHFGGGINRLWNPILNAQQDMAYDTPPSYVLMHPTLPDLLD